MELESSHRVNTPVPVCGVLGGDVPAAGCVAGWDVETVVFVEYAMLQRALHLYEDYFDSDDTSDSITTLQLHHNSTWTRFQLRSQLDSTTNEPTPGPFRWPLIDTDRAIIQALRRAAFTSLFYLFIVRLLLLWGNCAVVFGGRGEGPERELQQVGSLGRHCERPRHKHRTGDLL